MPPQERLRGQPVEEAEPYAGVPDAETFLLLDRTHMVTAAARRQYDPEYRDADPDDKIPSIEWERGEVLPNWAVTSYTWDGTRIAALDANGERIDKPGPHERADSVKAPETIRKWRESKGLTTVQMWACQVEGCGETFDTQQGLAAHARSHDDGDDAADPDATGATDDAAEDATPATGDARGATEESDR